MKKWMFYLSLLPMCLHAQDQALRSGPMIGYAEMRETVVWLQAWHGGKVFAIYDDLSTDTVERLSTDTLNLRKDEAFTAHLKFRNLEPGHRYSYRIYINGVEQQRDYPFEFSTQQLWDHREAPPAFRLAMGSCTYINEKAYDRPGEPYGGDYGIFRAIAAKDPDVMLWLGDNTYLRPGDFWTRSGYLHRYSHTRQTPELQELLASCPNFAIWDDHEFGPNDASGSWVKKELALEAFKLFWSNHSYGYPDLKGIMSAFRYNDIDVVLMDNRWHRSEQMSEAEEQIFGRKQADRLIDLLKFSRAPFKLVATGGQFLNSAEVYENHANYEEERAYILKRISEENINGVIFLSGDRHHSEISEMELESGHTVWDITSSPLTSGANQNVNEHNEYQVEGSLIQQRNFTTLDFSGPAGERKLKIRFYDSQGKEIFSHSIDSRLIYKNK